MSDVFIQWSTLWLIFKSNFEQWLKNRTTVSEIWILKSHLIGCTIWIPDPKQVTSNNLSPFQLKPVQIKSDPLFLVNPIHLLLRAEIQAHIGHAQE